MKMYAKKRIGILTGWCLLIFMTGSSLLFAQEAGKSRVKSTPVMEKKYPADVRRIEYVSQADRTKQPAYYYSPPTQEAVPLLVGLHTWSGTMDQIRTDLSFLNYAKSHQWAMIYPNFRGPNWTPQACGSDLVVSDIVSAVEFVKKDRKIDENRIYLMGSSGGGYLSLLMASRHPEIWAGVCAWVGITDLAAWHEQTQTAKSRYCKDLEKACGGAPGSSPEADQQYRYRSAITWADGAKGVNLNINHGLYDGLSGSVPVSHSLNFFNKLVPEEKRLSRSEIEYFVKERKVPEALTSETRFDPSYGAKKVLFRRESGNVCLTIFHGGHTCVPEAGFDWLSRQIKGKPADWSLGKASATSDAVDVQK